MTMHNSRWITAGMVAQYCFWAVVTAAQTALPVSALSAGASVAGEKSSQLAGQRGALAGYRHRVVVLSDIGGTDPDDFQSMVHLLVYADVLDIEGLISSPFGPDRKQHILEVIDCYETDYANLKTYSDRYPTPDALRAITKKGETERAPYEGVRRSTKGSEWIRKLRKGGIMAPGR